ncbi:MAG: uridine kinase [Polaromonas sp.]|nr:uridine kinase [Polaromonas sp.]MDP3751417.1 uridine kinase [Polaromonas sp.]
MRKLFLHPLFLFGLLVRLALIFISVPLAVSDWYVPFLDASTSQMTLDPWSLWLNEGGDQAAFPYGYAMWLAFLPLTLTAKLLGFPLLYGYAFTLLVADVLLLLGLKQALPGRDRLLLGAYWLSPIVILASYGLGLNDLIPVLLLTLSLFFTRRLQLKAAGVICFAAISAKLSMILALPFFLIYLFNNRALRQLVPQFVVGLLLGGMAFGLPFLFSSSGLQMLLGNPEMGKVYRLALNLGGNVFVYVVPLIYLVMLYMVWRVRRLNYDLFHATLGMAYLLIVLMTPASPGWFIWTIPLLVFYQAMSGRVAIALTGIFSGLYVLSTLLTTPLRFVDYGLFDLVNALRLPGQLGDHAASLLHTTMVATGVILALRIWRETVSRNDYFRLSRKPFVVGVAGDSGAGKDTFSDAIKGLFGDHSVVTLSGDDYHLWDRQKPMWQVMTHLNPMANDLEGLSNDLLALTDGKSIQLRHYDHENGKMSKLFRIKSNDFVIASGLHALYLPILRRCYNLSVYLDIDEGLRRHFKLQRDVHLRGHTVERVLSSFERREPDSVRFIRPQAAHADLVLSLQPIHARVLEDLDGKHPLRLKLVVRTRHGLNELSLNRVLVGVCGLHVDMAANNDGSEVVLTIEGDTSAQDIALAAQMLCPRILEFLDIQPKWQDGIMGLMQLITLSHINQALTKRFI